MYRLKTEGMDETSVEQKLWKLYGQLKMDWVHSDSYTLHQNRSKLLMRVVEKKAQMEVLISTLICTHWLFSLIPP